METQITVGDIVTLNVTLLDMVEGTEPGTEFEVADLSHPVFGDRVFRVWFEGQTYGVLPEQVATVNGEPYNRKS